MFLTSKANKSVDPCLFDIRIKTTDHNTILLKGPPVSASSVLFTGSIVLSVLEPIQIKSMHLKLLGTLNLNVSISKNKDHPRYTRYEKRFFEHSWNTFNFENFLDNIYDNYNNNGVTIDGISSDDLASNNSNIENSSGTRQRALSTASSGSLSSFLGSGPPNYRTLIRGNYEFPFSVILPGTLSESVEGLNNASVTYSITANIERGRGNPDLICKKKFRVVRTMAPDSIELSETLCVENSWPEKVEYAISIPAKAVAIGSSTPISIKLIPIMKRLRLGPIKVSLVEHAQYRAAFGSVTNEERTVVKMKVKDPLGHMKDLSDEKNGLKSIQPDEEIDPFQNSWDLSLELQIPASLSSCTQDCTIMKSLKVRHKLKFVISLINPDGHLSELRANLPIQLYISPFIALSVAEKHVTETRGLGVPTTSTSNLNSLLSGSSADSGIDHTLEIGSNKDTHNENIQDDSEMLFARSASNVDLTATLSSTSVPRMAELLAPPNYETHKRDRVYSNASNIPSDIESLSTTPKHMSMNDDLFLNELDDTPHLGTRTHSLNSNDFSRLVVPRTNSNDLQNKNYIPSQDFPTKISDINLNSFMSSSLASRRSRANSSASQTPLSFSPRKKKSEWEFHKLSRVPSYENAVKNDDISNDLPPAYPTDESTTYNLSASDLIRPKITHHRSSISNNSSRPTSIFPNPSTNNNSSLSLSDAIHCNVNSANLLNDASSQKSFSSGTGLFGTPSFLNMTQLDSGNKTEESRSQYKRLSISSDNGTRERPGSFSAFMGYFNKR